ncbi:MAG: sulfide:quinone reductase [Sulfurimonas sp. RIFOXYD12_FULL_33_39]|uniref:NAD(P)/FAD-dependent oxidoreductase n=1 Tax=unclassified Sulfurimonas TaxID=2623549 RepID=UPI0008B3DED6|nr:MULTISPECIES: FAD/NAD(P)-binding oxidoreductase [unclassified Sulfurimonas]OHE06898.1 MAG: sulfide:quinone reductase [Sulfurimonas sp. RIFCSPLOWO2_12_FULL_34_6]OHE10961.1 MAG: sulfide:quinone reductase [Sulfurimonas sp. RIFOXYD12_FULL_33_39]OHE13270.1 MAG: sulfide:quinone reductase [Sulfurimonas sp. RIFOXYD2_FULL_34_21]
MKKNEILKEILNEVDKHPEIMSRREALKYLTMSPLAASVLASASVGTSTASASSADVKGKIVILGGGLAGMSTAARLNNSISNADITVIEPDPISVSYQPGQTLVASGVWKINDIVYKRDEYVPSGVKLIKGSVTSIDPDNNKLTVDGSQEVTYNQLIVAAGANLNYAFIKGIEGEITSSGKDNAATKQTITKNGLHSLYFQDGAVATWEGIQELIAKAKAHKGPEKLQALFSNPRGAIKCGGAPLKIMYLTHARLVEAGVRDKVELTFNTNNGALFGIPDYNTPIVKQFEVRGFKANYKHNLIAVDVATKTATFNKWRMEKKEFEDEMGEKIMKEVEVGEPVEFKYDFMHVAPPMKSPDVVGKSKIGSGGWVAVNKETLQSSFFPNVWAVGDCAGVPMGKTGGSARKQYKVVVDNVVSAMGGKEPTAKYDGYTVCPLITGIGTVMLAEFNWTKKPTPSFPLDPTQERWIMWLLKVYALKPMTIHGMLSGKA